MRIVIHILRKDLRSHWWGIALFVASTACWAWQQVHPHAWVRHNPGDLPIILSLSACIVLTVSVIHGEVLVGDRQFWLTRPYRWWRLMAAKIAFLAIFLHLPVCVAQLYLLASAGLSITLSCIPGLLYLQLVFLCVWTLPAAVLAAITESISECVVAVTALIFFAILVPWLPWADLPVTLPGARMAGTLIGCAILVPALAFALLGQYAFRRTWRMRLVVAGVVLAIPAIVAASSGQLVRSIAYPLQSGRPPLRVEIVDNSLDDRPVSTPDDEFGSRTRVIVPVAFSSVAMDNYVMIEGSLFVLRRPDGWHWESTWSVERIHITNSGREADLSFAIPTDLANQLPRKRVTAQAELAVALYKLGSPQRIETGPTRFNVPHVGVCRWGEERPGTDSNKELICTSPFRMPQLLIVRIESGQVTCPSEPGEPVLPAGHNATDIRRDKALGPADFEPNPVRRFKADFGVWSPTIPSATYPGADRNSSFCRGTPIVVRTGSLAGRMRITADLGTLAIESRSQSHDSGTGK